MLVPMSRATDDLPYRTLRPWIREHFGRDLHRIALDAGSSCPNRDGAKGFGGCVYCDVEGSGTGALRRGDDLAQQLEQGLAKLRARRPGVGAVAYFQSYSNTYVDPARLDEVLGAVEPAIEEAVRLDDGTGVAVVALATRPDTLPSWALERLARLAQRVPVWLELGLESASDQVLTEIGRLHTVAEFEQAVSAAHEHGLQVVGHAILGLPGDGREGGRRTAELFARTGIAGVKVHHLMVLERTVLAHWWREGRVRTLAVEDYVQWLADFVERLGPEQVIHRLTGDSPPENLLAPHWDVHKNAVRELLAGELERRGTRQGSACAG